MANIMAILPGVTLADCRAMEIGELAEWHDRALARSGAED